MKKNILFTYNNYSTFVATDFEILSSKHEVSKYYFKPRKGVGGLLELIKQFIFLLFSIHRFDSIIIWFADYHAFFPVLFAKVFRKKTFVIIGGYDVANMPDLGYGSLSSPLRRAVTLFVFNNASCCFPVVESLENQLKEICPSAKSKTIHTGYLLDPEKLIDINHDRERTILTVSMTNSRQRMLIKGLDRFKELAEKLPDFQFLIIGVHENAYDLFEPAPPNLSLIAPLNQNELVDYYTKASFYAQFSRSEGLPNSLCEAMLYGCIPMGLKIGGIAAAIDDLGLVLDEWDCQVAADFIQRNHNKLYREEISKHIVTNFNLKTRKALLLELF